jgi:stage V sporulation protein D (sporulation-specific penicillin-binding protein)
VALVRKRETGDKRLMVVAGALFIGLLIVALKLVVIQGLEASKYTKLAAEQRDTSISITPHRGTIFDREGEIMAISEDVTTVYATPYQVKNKKDVAKKIASVLGEDSTEVQSKLEKKSGFVYLARKLEKPLADRLKKMKIPGIGYIEESKRYYPLGSLCSQVLGVVDIDNKGQAGLEQYYEKILGGRFGEVFLERDAAGNPIPGSEKRRREAVDGVDLRLTIDKDIQARVEDSLATAVDNYSAKAGTAIVLDCNTGDVLAMATCPTFDPNRRDRIDPATMRNRAITDIYEPGSALKIVTASAALTEGVVEPQTPIQVPSQLQVYDRTFKDAEPKPSRQLTFTQVISQSSNVGTIEVGLQLGAKRLYKYLGTVGLGHLTGIDFPGEVAGIVPKLSSWSGTSAATISIGQGISVTPIQLACVMGAIANGGRKIYPHFLSAKITGNGVKDMGLGGLGDEVMSLGVSQKMTAILEQVVSPGNTGEQAAVNYYRVAGKTGTAAKPAKGGRGYSGTYMATFAGFAPAEKPRLVCLVVFDEPSPIWGGSTSAPVFKEIMSYSLQHLKVPLSWGTNQGEAPVQQKSAGGAQD